jgi:hypothetical protein
MDASLSELPQVIEGQAPANEAGPALKPTASDVPKWKWMSST